MVTRSVVPAGAVRHGRHVCAVAGSGPEGLELVAEFVRAGLAAGDRVWFLPGGSGADLLGLLRGREVAVAEALAAGQLVVCPAGESPLARAATDPERAVGELCSAVRDALRAGWNGFRLVGEPGGTQHGAAGPGRLLEFEMGLSEAFADVPAAVLCQYDRYRFDAETMVALTSVHDEVLGPLSLPVGGELQIRPLVGIRGLRLVGEVDLAGREDLQFALSAVLAGTGDVHLELSELAFIDIGGVQALLTAADALGPDRRMVLHRPPRSLRLALDLLWDPTNLVEGE